MITLEQQKANRKLWADALRSGEFVQTTGELCTTGGTAFCCLGVLAVVSGMPIWSIANDGNLQGHSRAMEFVGLRDPDGEYANDCLAKLNDGGMSFTQIASVIESEPEGLFIEAA